MAVFQTNPRGVYLLTSYSPYNLPLPLINVSWMIKVNLLVQTLHYFLIRRFRMRM